MAKKKLKKEVTTEILPPRFELPLIGQNGNAFLILGLFQRGARKAEWTQEQIEAARNEMMDGDYDHLLGTVMKYCDVV